MVQLFWFSPSGGGRVLPAGDVGEQLVFEIDGSDHRTSHGFDGQQEKQGEQCSQLNHYRMTRRPISNEQKRGAIYATDNIDLGINRRENASVHTYQHTRVRMYANARAHGELIAMESLSGWARMFKKSYRVSAAGRVRRRTERRDERTVGAHSSMDKREKTRMNERKTRWARSKTLARTQRIDQSIICSSCRYCSTSATQARIICSRSGDISSLSAMYFLTSVYA